MKLKTLITGLIAASGAFAATAASYTCYVTRSYEDLLARQPNRVEAYFWPLFLQNNGSRAQFETVLTSSAEYKGELIKGWYQQYLKRQPSSSELTFFQNYMLQGATGKQIITVILSSTEYFNNTGANNTSFINAAFNDLLNRAPSFPEAATFWNMLNQGSTRAQVIQAIVDSLEFDTDEIKAIFTKFLRRLPAPAELSFYLQWMQNGATEELLIDHILATDEYFNFPCAAGR